MVTVSDFYNLQQQRQALSNLQRYTAEKTQMANLPFFPTPIHYVATRDCAIRISNKPHLDIYLKIGTQTNDYKTPDSTRTI